MRRWRPGQDINELLDSLYDEVFENLDCYKVKVKAKIVFTIYFIYLFTFFLSYPR